MASQQRYQQVRVHGTTYRVPEYWLLARQLVHARTGLSYLAAYSAAVDDWVEQAELERLHRKETTP